MLTSFEGEREGEGEGEGEGNGDTEAGASASAGPSRPLPPTSVVSERDCFPMRPSQALDHERGGSGTSEALVQRRTAAPTPHWGV